MEINTFLKGKGERTAISSDLSVASVEDIFTLNDLCGLLFDICYNSLGIWTLDFLGQSSLWEKQRKKYIVKCY